MTDPQDEPQEDPEDGPQDRRLAVIVPLVLALLVGGGAGAYALGWLGRPNPTPQTSMQTQQTPKPQPLHIAEVKPGDTTAPATHLKGKPDKDAIEQRMQKALGDKRLKGHIHAVIAPLDGDPVYENNPSPATPASTTKLLTTAAALDVYGAEHRFTTSVDRQGSTITLVGGGDPLLQDGGLGRLAIDTATALGATRTVHLAYDDFLFTGPPVDPHWRTTYLGSEVGHITALSVNGAKTSVGGYSTDPSGDAVRAFAKHLAKHGIKVVGKPVHAHRQGTQIASYAGITLRQIVEYDLQRSDNQIAETLAHQIGLHAGDPSFTGSVKAEIEQLKDMHVDTDGLTLYDGSGLTRNDKMPPTVLVSVLQKAANPDHPKLGPVLSGLPVAGWVGGLARRFMLDATPGRGYVRAKVGTLTQVSAYAGIVNDRRGTPIIAVMMEDGFKPDTVLDVRDALDDAMTALATCTCST
ncbi:MAG: D-alanyl-D-alanine carboxypeptidase/D-alanyl-D-alanine-endopeptidase [Nocardioides sp.]|nr:D-alanyl-D-alanine carboxypeptidase/D-alanyl-D-alanine-endopeptidase [Nocardioides sp.]